MGLDVALNAARSGLAAVQRGLAQASDNVANADTPGATRKAVPQRALAAGQLPLGVRTGDAQRAVDAALLARLDLGRGDLASATAREALLSGVEAAHGANGGMLTDALAALRAGFVALRAAPADAGKQGAALDAARGLARRLNDVSAAIGDARQQAQDGIVAEVASANAALREIAELTIRIKGGAAGDAAALEDRRDLAIGRLAETMSVQAVRRPDGDLLLLGRNGVVLPLSPDRDALSTAPATAAPAGFHGPGGALPGVLLDGVDVTAALSGGRLGEYVALRDTTLPRYQAEADLLAAAAAGRFEAQGLRLFTDTDGTVPPPGGAYGGAQIGFAGRIRVADSVAADPSLLRDGTHATADFTPNPAGGPAGFTDLLDRVLDRAFGAESAPGTPWPAIPTGGLGPDGTLASPFAAGATLEAYAGRLAAAQTGDRAAATAAKERASTLQAALQSRFDRQSGIDVDSEMAGMVALQNAYAANARVMGAVQAMWDALLAAVR